jgi:hypothetical protein
MLFLIVGLLVMSNFAAAVPPPATPSALLQKALEASGFRGLETTAATQTYLVQLKGKPLIETQELGMRFSRTRRDFLSPQAQHQVQARSWRR